MKLRKRKYRFNSWLMVERLNEWGGYYPVIWWPINWIVGAIAICVAIFDNYMGK